MGKETGISWCDATWNVARGCSKKNNDCIFCYMMRDGERYGYDGKKVQRTKTVFNFPLKYKETKSNVWQGRPLIFTSSLTDFFHEDIDSFRNECWDIIRKCPHLIFQILTKRPERIKEHLPSDWGNGWDNVWLGVSAGNQKNYDTMIYAFNTVPSKVKFLSAEPLHGPILLHGEQCEWDFWSKVFNQVIIGGESGFGNKPKDPNVKYGYRECKLEWIESLVNQCKETNTPVFVKQLGTHLAKEMGLKSKTGADIAEFPSHIAYQQFPKISNKEIEVSKSTL